MSMNEEDRIWLKKFSGLLTEEDQKVSKTVVGHEDKEPKALQRELHKMEKYAKEMHDMLENMPSADIPSWIQKKLVIASDYMSTVKHYLEYDVDSGTEEKSTTEEKPTEKTEEKD